MIPGDSFVAWIVDRLSGLGDVEARRMFGGHGLYHHGTIFGIEHDGRLYLKTDASSRPAFLERGMSPFRPTERQTLHRYFEVPADVLADDDALLEWATAAVRASERVEG